jgi:hypothetical protein
MRDVPLQPGLAVDQPDGEPIHIPPELARELIETDAGVGREWRRWKGIGGDRGLVLLLRPDLVELVRRRLDLATPGGRLDDSDRATHRPRTSSTKDANPRTQDQHRRSNRRH